MKDLTPSPQISDAREPHQEVLGKILWINQVSREEARFISSRISLSVKSKKQPFLATEEMAQSVATYLILVQTPRMLV